MKNKGLTISMIFKAESANYGEGFGNISTLKKISNDQNEEHTYISRQALRYNIVEQLGWDNTEVELEGKGDAAVVQFAPSAKIDEYPEIDLFGYMKTSKKSDDNAGGAQTRNAVVRLSNAIALSRYNDEMDYLTNIGLAKRKNFPNAIAQSEIDHSYYGYTITIDLERIGVDENDNINLPNDEKAKRVCQLLDTVQYLYRDIRGRRENLAPLFIVGGVYDRKNPFFEHRLNITQNKLNTTVINQILTDPIIKKDTEVGLLQGILNNDEEIVSSFNPRTISEFFNNLKDKVNEYYQSN